MNKITSKYLIVLAILTVVILGSQILMQKSIKDSKSDARIINISGRQRMLSQKITKATLKIKEANTEAEFALGQGELHEAVALWTRSHQDLQNGSDEIDVSEMNSSQIAQALFGEIEPFFQNIKDGANHLLNLNFGAFSNPDMKPAIDQAVQKIISNEASFLKLMNQITFEYDRQASARIESLSTAEYYLMGFTFLLILMEVFFIFRPMFLDSKKKEQVISELNLLRADEKSYSGSHIQQANQKIKDLRKLGLKLKEELIDKDKEYTFKTTNQMMENVKLKAELEYNQKEVEKLQRKLQNTKLNI